MIRNQKMLALIATCGKPAWEASNAPKQPGMNGTKREGYEVRAPKCMKLMIPEFAQLTQMTSPKGSFIQVKFYGVEINDYTMTAKIGTELVGMFYLMLKRWFPIAAEGASVPENAIENYEYYFKVEAAPANAIPEGTWIICNAKKTGRRAADMYEDGIFAHSNHTGRNQHIEIHMVETDEEEAFLANRRPRREKQPSNATQSPGDSIQFSYFEWDWKENAPVDEIFKAVERLSKDGKLATVFDVHFDGDAYAKVVMAHGGTQQMAQHILDQFFRFEHGTFYPADMMGYDNDEPRKVRGVRA